MKLLLYPIIGNNKSDALSFYYNLYELLFVYLNYDKSYFKSTQVD